MKFKVGEKVICLHSQTYNNGNIVPIGSILTIRILKGHDFISEEDHPSWHYGLWAFLPSNLTKLERLIYDIDNTD